MKLFLVATGLVVVLCFFGTGSSLTCLQCNDAVNITDCLDATTTCGAGEKCFLEQLTTDTNQVVINAGCRSDGVCNIMSSLVSGVGKRDLDRKGRSIVTCSKCCDDPKDSLGPCNAKLCGQKPSSNRPPKCLDCTLKASSGACLTRTSCQETQVCGNEIMVIGGSLVRYNYYCEERHLCVTAYQTIENNGKGRRTKTGHADGSGGVVICNSCCIGDECNKVDCFTLQHNFTSADFQLTTTKPKAPATTKPTQAPTTQPITKTPTTQPTTPKPTTQPTTPKPTTQPTTPKPTTQPTTPKPTTQPTTPKPTTQPITTKKASTPVPAASKPASTPVPASNPAGAASTPPNPMVVG